MSYQFFEWKTKSIETYEGQGESIGILTIDIPPMNALSSAVLKELDGVLDMIESSKERLFILMGKGKAFVAGADISEMQDLDPKDARGFAQLGQSIFSRIENNEKISIAAVNGFALGGGLELALSCDIRIFSEKAQVGLPEVTLGLIPGFGGTQRLAREIGKGNANYLILSAERVKADEALRLGIAQKVVEPKSLLLTCESVAAQILKNGPNAIIKAKRLIDVSVHTPIKQGLEQEADQFSALFRETGEPKEGLSAFLEKRTPGFEK